MKNCHISVHPICFAVFVDLLAAENEHHLDAGWCSRLTISKAWMQFCSLMFPQRNSKNAPTFSSSKSSLILRRKSRTLQQNMYSGTMMSIESAGCKTP